MLKQALSAAQLTVESRSSIVKARNHYGAPECWIRMGRGQVTMASIAYEKRGIPGCNARGQICKNCEMHRSGAKLGVVCRRFLFLGTRVPHLGEGRGGTENSRKTKDEGRARNFKTVEFHNGRRCRKSELKGEATNNMAFLTEFMPRRILASA